MDNFGKCMKFDILHLYDQKNVGAMSTCSRRENEFLYWTKMTPNSASYMNEPFKRDVPKDSFTLTVNVVVFVSGTFDLLWSE